MKQSLDRGLGLKRAPLALSLSLVLAAGVVSDAFAVDHSAGISAVRERIAQQRQSPSVQAAVQAQRHNRLERARAKAAASAAPAPLGAAAVTNCNDSGADSLRNAVENANDGDVVDLTALACSTITLTTGSIVVDVDNLTIQGPGAGGLTINANGSDVAFDFIGYGALEIEGVTVTNGHYYGYCGGAIWSAYGDVVLTDAVLSNSSVEGSGYIGGAGVCNYDGDVIVNRSTVTGNTVDADSIGMGPALFSKYGSVIVTDSVVTGNSGNSAFLEFGGALYAGEAISVTRSTISGNQASGDTWGGGGGAYSYTGSLTVVDSTISGNSVSHNGGGAFVVGLTATNSTFSGNEAGGFSGAAAVMGGNAQLSNSTITGNTAADGGGVLMAEPASVTLNSVLAYGNTSTAPDYYGADLDGSTVPAIAGSHNLVGDSLLALPGDTIATNPLLGPLANNGGPTQTHALLAGSPAIDMGNNVAALANDQRGTGFARVVAAAADIGAFEVQGGDPGPGPGPIELATPRAVPAASSWALGMLALLLGFIGWRRTER